jgi:predicted DNA-binding protein (UPF0251 family)
MPRPRKHRFCRRYDADRVYKPQGIPMRRIETVAISLDQFEALRLCDSEQLDQEAAGRRMGVSRGTIQRLLYKGRQKIVEAILHQRALVINLQESEDTNAGMHSHQRQRRTRRHSV